MLREVDGQWVQCGSYLDELPQGTFLISYPLREGEDANRAAAFELIPRLLKMMKTKERDKQTGQTNLLSLFAKVGS